MKRVLLLSDVNSAHTRKWVEVMLEKELKIGIYSLSSPKDEWCLEKGIQLFLANDNKQHDFHASHLKKSSYLKHRKYIRNAIQEFKPELVHAHYASSYGLLGALSGFSPYYISAWGSDLLMFPSNILNRAIIKYNLKKANKVIVSSNVLNEAAQKFKARIIKQIAFGVDTNLFTYKQRKAGNVITIGIVKSLEHVYGIDTLFEAFAKLVAQNPEIDFKLKLVGEGSQKENLQHLSEKLSIASMVEFCDPVSQQELVPFYHSFDIGVFLSRSESFGVAILEAEATGLPVVVSKVGGLMEVSDENKTALWVEKENPEMAYQAMQKLVDDPELRCLLGENARRKVIQEFSIEDTKKKIWSLYGV
jgi:glycosyltransferase involved in cell wall biosynthesis